MKQAANLQKGFEWEDVGWRLEHTGRFIDRFYDGYSVSRLRIS